MPKLKFLKEREKEKEKIKKGGLIQLRVNEAEYNAILAKAIKYADGEMSEWLRYAGTLDPRKEDLA